MYEILIFKTAIMVNKSAVYISQLNKCIKISNSGKRNSNLSNRKLNNRAYFCFGQTKTTITYIQNRRTNLMKKTKDTIIWMGAGQIGLAIIRRIGSGKKIIVGDKNLENAENATVILNDAGFDTTAIQADLSSRESIRTVISEALKHGEIKHLINAAGVSPSQASIETILKVDLYGTAVLLEEVGKVIANGGTGITISSQSGHRLQDLGPKNNELLAVTPTEKLLQLDILQPSQIKNTLHAYQLAKRCNVKRVMAEAVLWGKRGARINSISPGIIVTPLAKDEFNGPRGDFYKNMISKCPAGRPGTPDEVAHIAELLLSEKGSFISGSDFLIDGGATASYFYGPLQPNK